MGRNFSQLLQRRQQAPNGVNCLNHMAANQDLIPNCSFNTPPNETVNRSTWNYMISTSEMITRPKRSLLPLRNATLPWTMHCVVIISFFHPFSIFTNLSFYTAQWSSFLLLHGYYSTHKSLNTVNMIFKFTQLNICCLTDLVAVTDSRKLLMPLGTMRNTSVSP